MSETQKLNPQNQANDLKLALSPEQEQRFQKEKEEVLMLSKSQRNTLSNEVISSYLEKHHNIDLSKYSPEIKQKFIEEIQMTFVEFKTFNFSMISNLREIRETMSFGMESGKNDDYYRNMIIGKKIEEKIIILKEVIRVFSGDKLTEKDLEIKKILDKINNQKGIYFKGFGLDYLGNIEKSGYNFLKETYQAKLGDVENFSTIDLVIIMRVLFGVIPIAGDMVGGYDDGKQALAGVNFDGSMHGLGENAFMYLISGLQLSIVGGSFAKLSKGPKLAKAMMTLGKIIDKLSNSPEMLKDLAKNEKVMNMLEAMKGLVPKVDGLLGKMKQSKKGEVINATSKFEQKITEIYGVKGIYLEKQEPKTAYCGQINLNGVLGWVNKNFGDVLVKTPEFSKFSYKKGLSPQEFQDFFSKSVGGALSVQKRNFGEKEAITFIQDQLINGIPIPMIYVPIGGKIQAPHYATIVGIGKNKNGEIVYKIQDSMRDFIPRDFLTEKELISTLKFETLGSENKVKDLALKGVSKVAKKYLGGEINLFDIKIKDSGIKKQLKVS